MFCGKRISMLTSLTTSSLLYKCIFYNSQHSVIEGPHGVKFEGLEIQKSNIPTDRAQSVDEKNRLICLAIMFTPGINGSRMFQQNV